MPTPDQSDDFSHLPTIDDGHDEARLRKEALWARSRREQAEAAAAAPAAADSVPVEAPQERAADFVPESVPESREPEVPADHAETPPPPAKKPPAKGSAAHAQQWRELLNSELEDPRFSATPGGLVEATPPAPAPVPEAAPKREPEPQSHPRIRVNRSVIRPASAAPAPGVGAASAESARPPVAAGNESGKESAPASAPAPAEKKPSYPIPKVPEVARQAAGSVPAQPAADKAPGDLEAKQPEDSKAGPGGEAAKAGAKVGKEADGSAKTGQDGLPLPPVEAAGDEAPKSGLRKRWEKLGGLALTLSIGVHLLLVGAGTYWVVSRSDGPAVDFLPGGGTAQGKAASEALEHHIQQKKSPWLKKSLAKTRLAVADKKTDLTLPDLQPDMLDMPKASLMAPSSLGKGLGLGGAGGGFGSGIGMGGRGGMVFQPFSMFGHAIKAKKMAVVLDVSTSMAPHLPRVIAEVDRAARGSVVVLYFGCGLDTPPGGGKRIEGDEVFRTSSVEFEKYWRLGGASLDEVKSYKIDPKVAIPSEDIFRMLSKRPQTYFIHSLGTGYTWTALLSNEVRSADALYWFSDFEDHVDPRQLTIVQENLKSRRQRLYIHAYEHGSSFDLVRTQLVTPSGGEVIEEPP